MTYTIPFDSPLGQQLTEYFYECDRCNNATADFIRTLGIEHPNLGFPTLTDIQASQVSYQALDSVDAGGLVAITMPESLAAQLAPSIDPDLWVKVTPSTPSATVTDASSVQAGSAAAPATVPDGSAATDHSSLLTPNSSFFCPRFTLASFTWHRYKKALNIYNEHASDPAYRFELETNHSSRAYGQPKMYQYYVVRHSIMPYNKQQLQTDGKGPITDQTRLALVTRFALRRDYDITQPQGVADHDYITTAPIASVMAKGRQLYELIEDLPTVPANQMLRILKLKVPADAKRGFRPTFEYHTDEVHREYIIDTNLRSAHPNL